MNGDDDVSKSAAENAPGAAHAPEAPDDVTQLDIVTILQALEERVASHADRIAAQLAPVRDSINDLSTRLERLEERRPDQGVTANLIPGPEQKPTPQPEPLRTDSASESPGASSAFVPDTTQPDSDDVAPAQAPATPAPEQRPAGVEPTDPGQISEADIHAADVALKSELTGLFDDGTHQRADSGPTN